MIYACVCVYAPDAHAGRQARTHAPFAPPYYAEVYQAMSAMHLAGHASHRLPVHVHVIAFWPSERTTATAVSVITIVGREFALQCGQVSVARARR